ncbi:MAG: hypothetical protein CVV44_17235 [Spirochaetae bacterium HGW-Spirochaetae-1]|jgi:transcriptional regulator with XRE-family HTH domain|nr:MAG: hypothetical protein CVV44_17235 [Spirochaetae bacterium HGW-Spirochaetae-1]
MPGKRIRELRELLNITKHEFSHKTGLPFTCLKAVESGAAHPDLEYIQLILEKYPVSAQWLLRGQGPMIFPEDTTELLKDPRMARMLLFLDTADDRDIDFVLSVMDRFTKGKAG